MILYTDFAEVLRKKIREYLNDEADGIARGECTDFADYKRRTGVIEGLAIAERELLDLVREEDKHDE